jgi:hypothetical protein
MSESPGKTGFSETYRPRRGPMTWGHVALIWASGVILILVLWAVFAGRPTNWPVGIAIALICPSIGITSLAWKVHERAGQPGKNDVLKR